MNYLRLLIKNSHLTANLVLQSRLRVCQLTHISPPFDRTYSTGMSKLKVYITRQINEEAHKLLADKYDVSSWTGPDPVPRDVLMANLADTDALFVTLTDRIDEEILKNANQLKVVATMSVGYDHLDLNALKQRRIKIGYTPDVLSDATAELTVALLLATSRRLIESHQEAMNGGWRSWSPFWMCGPSLTGSTVGIVGFGRIGCEVAKRLKSFKVKQFLYHNRSAKKEANEIPALKVEFDQLLSDSDFVIVCCALTPDTRHLFNDQAFAKMKSNAVLINTSRGPIVDQDALVRALMEKRIWAAGLDVTTPEPLPVDHPLFKLTNCVILPHIGSAAIQTRNQMASLTANNIIMALEDRPMPAELVVH